MRIIAKKTLQNFWLKHSQSEQQLKARYIEISQAVFLSANDILKKYPRASSIGDNRIVFRIKGNDYRLIGKINYDYQILWIRFVGTHQEYDKINAETI